MQRSRERAQSDRIIFNGRDLSALAYCKVSRPIMGPVEATFQAVGARPGEVFRRARRSGYDLTVDMWLRAERRREVAEARHALAAALWTDAPAPLYLPDDPTRYLLAIVSGDTDLGEIADGCPCATVAFHIGDPAFYGQRRRLEVRAGDILLDAGGTLPAALEIVAQPTGGSPWRIEDAATGAFVELSERPQEGDVVRIDMATERATVNEATAAVTLDSDFFSASGRARLALSDGTATLRWRERWL